MADTLSWIYNRAFRILQNSSPSGDDIALMIACLNSARSTAEKMVDFEMSKVIGYQTIDATNGGSASTIGTSWNGTSAGSFALPVKKIRRIDRWDTTNSVWVPASLMTYDYYRDMAEQIGRSNGYSYLDSQNVSYPDPVFPTKWVYLREGETIYSSDESSTAVDTTIRMYVYKWLTAYQDGLNTESAQVLATILAQTDFIIQNCDSYLTWWAVREYNSRSANFVPRNEGSLDPAYIDARVEEAWNAMVAWNAELSPSQNYLGAPQ